MQSSRRSNFTRPSAWTGSSSRRSTRTRRAVRRCRWRRRLGSRSCSRTSARRTRTSAASRRNGWSTGCSRRPNVSFRELLEKGQIAEFPALQLALGAMKGRIDPLTVASIGTGGSKEEYPLVEIHGTPTSYQVKVLEDSPEYLDWLNSALLCAGFVEPIGLTAIARRLAEYEDIILGVDTNILYASILGEHLLDEFHRIHMRPYKESVNWILLVIPGVVMKELENAANMKKGNRLSHAGRRGYRALQEITTLKGTEGYQGLSVLVVGPTNPEQLHLSPDGLTIVNADSMIRDQFKAFLRGIDFRKGVFFLTMDKTNASLAAAEGLTALRIQYPRRLRKGEELAMLPEGSVLLARLVYELAVEFGTVRVTWEDHGPHYIDLEGSWTWKSMEHWEAWQLLRERHAIVDEAQPREDRPSERPHAGLGIPNRGVVQAPEGEIQDFVSHSVHPRHRVGREPADAIPRYEVGTILGQREEKVREPIRRVRRVRVQRREVRPPRGREPRLVRPAVTPARLHDDPGSLPRRDVPRSVPRIRVDDHDFDVPSSERREHFIEDRANRGLFIHRRDDDGDLGHRRAMLGSPHKCFALTRAKASRTVCTRRIRGARR